jgi:hypothetical protein
LNIEPLGGDLPKAAISKCLFEEFLNDMNHM